MTGAYIRGAYAKASVALIAELKKQGIAATVGYDTDRRTRNNTLIAYVAAQNAFQVPREWKGFKVTVHVDNNMRTSEQKG